MITYKLSNYDGHQSLVLNYIENFLKKSIRTVFKSSAKLKSIFCYNKSKLLPNSYPGVHEFYRSWQSRYFGETKKQTLSRTIENQ